MRRAAERYLRDCLLGVVTATVAALFAAVSLEFATFAAYVHLCVSEGPVAAALIICATYGVLAIAIWAIGVMRRRATRTRRAAALALASSGDGDLLRESLAAAGTPKDPLALIAAIRLGRELSTMQLLALTLVAGFIAGIKFRKRDDPGLPGASLRRVEVAVTRPSSGQALMRGPTSGALDVQKCRSTLPFSTLLKRQVSSSPAGQR